jgi:DNA-binding MarR family transcriptional regulator
MCKKYKVISNISNDVKRVFQGLNDHSTKAKKETGLTGPQLWAIKMIGEMSPVRVSDLAARTCLHPSTVVGILNRLELRRLIKRRRTHEDRRVVEIALTDAGHAIAAKAAREGQGPILAGLEELSLGKLQDISAGIEELAHMLGTKSNPP